MLLRVYVVLLLTVGIVEGAGSGSCSGSGSNACATPDPVNHLQTILTWDCNGRIRFLPDNPVFNVNIDAPLLRRGFTALLDGINTYVTAHCDALATSINQAEFLERFHPISVMLYGNRLYKGGKPITAKSCLDDYKTFTRDLLKVYESFTGKSSFEMPSSCPYYYWEQNGNCSFTHELMELGAELQFVAKRCDTTDFFKFSLGCAGPGCSVFKPCREDSDCNSKDHLICADPFQWEDPKVKGPAKFTEADVYNILRDTFRLYASTGDVTTETCDKPRKLFETFIKRFAKYIIDSPEALGRSSCESGTCKICLPNHITAFEDIFQEFPGRWKEVDETKYPKSRLKYDKDGCALSPERIAGNSSFIINDDYPTIAEPSQPPGLYPGLTSSFATSPLVMGTKMYLKGSKIYIGGNTCAADAMCGTTGTTVRGICINNVQYCTMAQDECSKQDLCEWDPASGPSGSCIPTVSAAADTSKKCACFVLEKLTSTNSSYGFIYGKTCADKKYIPVVEANSIASAIYADGVHKWRGQYDPFIYWKGKYAADGIDPFTVRDHWKAFPDTTAPDEETHIASVECNGVIHFLQNTPFAVRIHAPMLSDVLQWWAEVGLDVWKCRDSRNMNDIRYLISNALWRPEPWLYAKVVDLALSSHSEPPGFINTLTQWMFPTVANALSATGFELFNFQHLAKLASDFHLSKWTDPDKGGEVGTEYTGMRGVQMDQAWSLRFRASACPSHTMGLVRYDLTCLGRSCSELMLDTTCDTDSDCALPSKCLNIFSDIYDEDLPKQMMWGAEREMGTGVSLFTDESLCPALEGYGKNGQTSRVNTKEPIRSMVSGLWESGRFAGCTRRKEDDCWGQCEWTGTCLDKVKMPTISNTKDLKFCAPYVYPPYEAFVTSRSAATPIIGKPNSTNLYTLKEEKVHGASVSALVFGVADDSTTLAPPLAMTSEPVEKPVVTSNTATFGTSFIAVMLAMALIVCVASACVWYNYIKVTKSERERVSRLLGLTFFFKRDNDVYGRDLMIPEMENRWLPGQSKANKKKAGSAESLVDKVSEEDLSDKDSVPLETPKDEADNEVEMDELTKSALSPGGSFTAGNARPPSTTGRHHSRRPSSSPRPGSEEFYPDSVNGSFGGKPMSGRESFSQIRSPVYGKNDDWTSVVSTGSPARKKASRVPSHNNRGSGSSYPGIRLPSAKQQLPVDEVLPPGPSPSGRQTYHHPQQSLSPVQRHSINTNPLQDQAISEARGTISRGGTQAIGSAVDKYAKTTKHGY